MNKKYFLLTIYGLVFFSGFSQINFIDESTSLGLGISCGDTPIGNGITFYDYNGDGWDDITLPTESGKSFKFFKNVNGTFVEDFLNIPVNTSQMKQINWVDYDNDGDIDLYVTSNVSGNKLYANDGNFNFSDVTSTSLLPTANISTYGSSWGDYNNDGFLDVFLCSRDNAEITPNYLYKNNGDGTFLNVSMSAGILQTSNLSFCSAFFDFNNDGWQDIYVSKDRSNNLNVLYKNNGDGTFTDVSASSNTNLAIDAMSVTIGDYNNDGWQDIYVTNTPSGNVFLKNNGDETFTNIAVATGTTFNSIGWGAVFLDAENDMDLDLYVSGLLNGSNSNYLSAAFYENNGSGVFSIPSSGFVNDTRESYSNAIGDVNNDGLPEIVVSNANNENIFVWKNITPSTNNWLKVNLEGTQSNSRGIGSKIEISINGNKQYRYTHCGEGYLAQNSGTEIFGLGSNAIVDYVKVYWLSGITDIVYNVDGGQVLTIVEGSTLSVDEFEASNINLYPNPTKSTLHIDSKYPILNLTLHSILGNELPIVLSQNQVNVSYLQTGIYFLSISTSHRKTVHKFLKN